MYKILVADDEGIVRQSLQFIIEKHFQDVFTLYLAKNGRQAIELAEEHRPDIAILDINMPGISGLGALREIRRENTRIRALILTAFDNFDYAREALELGAEDYLMKPIDKDKLVSVLGRMIREIDAERQKRQDELNIREKLEAVLPIIVSGFVQSLMVRDDYGFFGRKYRELLEVREENGLFMMVEWGDGEEESGSGKLVTNPVGSSVRARRFASAMNSQIAQTFHCYKSEMIGNRMAVVIPSESETQSYEERLQLIEKARRLEENLRAMVGIEFHIGIGGIRPWEKMYESYREAMHAMRYGVREVTHIDDLIVRNEEERWFELLKGNLITALNRGKSAEVKREAESFASAVLSGQSSLDDIRIEFLELFMEARQLVREKGKNPEETGAWLIRSRNADELREAFLGSMSSLADALSERTGKDTPVEKARRYIEENFQKELSLDSIAELVNVSPYYFSKLFKEELGINFSDYLTDCRINRAKELLYEDPNRNIKEVSIACGYSNPNYFSRIFKKITGMTPTELRDTTRDGTE